MSQSTNANIAFGVNFGEDQPFPWVEKDLDLAEWWAAENGLVPPAEAFSETSKAHYLRFWKERDALEKSCPVELCHHCFGDYPMFILAVRGTEQTVYGGNSEEVKIHEVDPKPLLDFCAKYKIELPGKPKWLLYSYWG